MRVVVFTGNPNLSSTPWFRLLQQRPGVDAILVCRKIQSAEPRQVLRRFRRNVAIHGWIFVPYRASLLALALLRRMVRRETQEGFAARIPVEEIEALDIHAPEILEQVRSFNADLGLSLGAPILKPAAFRLPRHGTLNLHCGKVPEFRGAPPAFWELEQGAKSIGATVHWVDEGLDTGAVVAAAEAPIYPHDTLLDVEDRATELGVRVLSQALTLIGCPEVPSTPQKTSAARANRFPTLRQRARLGFRISRRRALSRLAPRSLAKSAVMGLALYVYRPLRDTIRRVRRRHPVRVFTYHRVSNLCRDGMTVSPRVFRKQIEYLTRHCDVITLERAVDLIRSGARLARPAAVLTFDDAYESVHAVAHPVLAEFGVPGCVFVSTDLVETTDRFEHDRDNPVREYLEVMNWKQLADLVAKGWSLGSHTASHARLSACAGAVLQREIEEPRRALREHLRVAADVLAYPFGTAADFSDEAHAMAKRAGHSAVFANFAGENCTGDQSFLLGRFDLGGDHDELAWKSLAHGIDLGRFKKLWPR